MRKCSSKECPCSLIVSQSNPLYIRVQNTIYALELATGRHIQVVTVGTEQLDSVKSRNV